jgi:hypothetical protein
VAIGFGEGVLFQYYYNATAEARTCHAITVASVVAGFAGSHVLRDKMLDVNFNGVFAAYDLSYRKRAHLL